MSSTDFEQHVVASLARLETSMDDLLGKGKKGRIEKIEDNVTYLIIGLVVLAAIVLGPQAIALIR